MKPKPQGPVPVVSFNERFKVLEDKQTVRDMATGENIRFRDRASANLFLGYTSKL